MKQTSKIDNRKKERNKTKIEEKVKQTKRKKTSKIGNTKQERQMVYKWEKMTKEEEKKSKRKWT